MRKVQQIKGISQIGPTAAKDKQLQTDDSVKAEIMNDYSLSVGKTLAQNFTEQKEHQYNHSTSVTQTLQNIGVDTTFLEKQITTIKPTKATGNDQVRPKDLNLARESTKEEINIVDNQVAAQAAPPAAADPVSFLVLFYSF